MKALILGAGYATRLYPLTKNFPKPLLKVKDKEILNWLIEDIDKCGKIDEYIVISNAKFYNYFNEWAKTLPQKITVLNDGTYSNETRLGAVKDIEFAIKTLNLDCDLLVLAGDNLLDFSLVPFIKTATLKNATCVLRYYEEDINKLKKSGVLEVDGNGLVINMEEKPSVPKSNWCCPPFYYYSKQDVKKVALSILDGINTDAPGSFIAWLTKKSPVYALKMDGNRYDIGNIESYNLVTKIYNGIIK